MTVTLTDLLALPASPERDQLIDRERVAIHARYDAERTRDATALDITETTRTQAETLLDQLPREPGWIIKTRRRILADATSRKDPE